MWSSAAASSSAMVPVPSGELSSATRMSTDGTALRTRSVISRMFSASL
jgi:hypothetical protein